MAGVFIAEMRKTESIGLQVQLIVLGEIHRDFVISTKGKSIADIPGGPALYFAVGAALWKKNRIGVVSHVGDDFPYSKLNFLSEHGIDFLGVQVLPHPMDNRAFHSGIADSDKIQLPTTHYDKLERELPRSLLGYQQPQARFGKHSFNGGHGVFRIPSDYLKSHLAHLCSVKNEFQIAHTSLVQSRYPGRISQYLAEIPPTRKNRQQLIASLNDVFCVMIKKNALMVLFDITSDDFNDFIQSAMKLRSDYVVVLLGEQGRILLEPCTGKKWFVPLYPLQAINPTGKNHAFCGGFASSICGDYDPLEAVLAGAVSSSLVAEGIGLQYPLEAPRQLLETRLNRLRTLVRRL